MARVRSGTEIAVCEEIGSSLGLEAYCPMFARWRKLPKHIAKKRGKSKELIRTVLFPCYIFVKITSLECVTRIKGLRDVLSFISTGHGPCLASEEDVQALRYQESLGINDETEKGRKLRNADRLRSMTETASKMELQDLKGCVVRMMSGLFAGKVGSVLQYDKTDNVVKLDIGRISVTVSAESVSVI